MLGLALTDLRRVVRMPPSVIARKAAGRLRGRMSAIRERRVSLREGTYPRDGDIRLRRRVGRLDAHLLEFLRWEEVAGVAEHYLAHRFDILGSGWVNVAHGIRCRGLEGYRFEPETDVHADPGGRWLAERVAGANLAHARQIWGLVDPGYQPIDWHLDFKSGYRWDESTWHADIRYGAVPGADVKVPWELARSQHLPQLALAHALAVDGDARMRSAGDYAREIRNEILDFAATNPPGFGVNWACGMDVGIRAVNQLLAYDLLRAHGADLDESFERELGRSVLAHARHLAGNLEWDPGLRANHYLADIVGLLFCSAYLPRSTESDAWLAFCVQELVSEVESQFHPEGASFEASTSYHRLSTELVLYGTALVCGLVDEELGALAVDDRSLAPSPPGLRESSEIHVIERAGRPTPFPAWYMERLERAAEFTLHATKPDGHVVQIGDNDSGRLLKLVPVRQRISVAEARERYANLAGYEELADEDDFWTEDHLDHAHILAAVGGLVDRPDLVVEAGTDGFEAGFVRSLARGMAFPSYRRSGATGAEEVVVDGAAPTIIVDRDPDQEILYEVRSGTGLEGLETFAYPEFGLYIFRSTGAFIAIRCGSVGQRGNGGHAHNDALSVSVTVDGVDRTVDPGTYLYTPVPEIRNVYRSVGAHHAPQVEGQEPGRLDLGLFTLGDKARAECLHFGRDGFLGRHTGFGPPVYRGVYVQPDAVRVVDWAEGGLSLVPPRREVPVSEGYGIILGGGSERIRGEGWSC